MDSARGAKKVESNRRIDGARRGLFSRRAITRAMSAGTTSAPFQIARRVAIMA
jgi:hypothetical protein